MPWLAGPQRIPQRGGAQAGPRYVLKDLSPDDPTIWASFLFLELSQLGPTEEHVHLKFPLPRMFFPNIIPELILVYYLHPSANIPSSARSSLSISTKGSLIARPSDSLPHHPVLCSSCPLLWSETISLIYLSRCVPFPSPNKSRDSVHLLTTASLPPGTVPDTSWGLNTCLLTISWKV